MLVAIPGSGCHALAGLLALEGRNAYQRQERPAGEDDVPGFSGEYTSIFASMQLADRGPSRMLTAFALVSCQAPISLGTFAR